MCYNDAKYLSIEFSIQKHRLFPLDKDMQILAQVDIRVNNVSVNTHGDKMIHTLLVKYFNDLLDGQKSERSIDKVTYFYVGDLFCIHLGTKYANFQEKIFAEISGKKFQTLGTT